MKEWLEVIVKDLQRLNNQRCQFISAICIACCIVHCHFHNLFRMKEFLFPLLIMLRVQPDEGKRACSDVSYLYHTSHHFRYIAHVCAYA